MNDFWTFACAHHKFLFSVCKTNKTTKYIIYHVCFDNTDSLPGDDDDDDDDDDTGDISMWCGSYTWWSCWNMKKNK